MSSNASRSDAAAAVPSAARIAGARAFLPELEALRGLAILLVVLFHYKGILVGDQTPLAAGDSLWWAPVYVGNTGVTLFFVLSGFLLSSPFLASLHRGDRPDLRRYAVSRVLRIVPLYYLAVVTAWLTLGEGWSTLRALAFLPVGFGLFPFGVPWWSLTTEVQFYVLLPAAVALWRPRWGRAVLLAVLVVWFVNFANLYSQRHWMASEATMVWRDSLFGRAPSFLCGVLAAWLHLPQPVAGWASSARGRRGLALLGTAALAALLVAVARAGLNEADLALPVWHVLESMAWAAIVLFAAGAPLQRGSAGTTIGRALDATLGHLGRISYALFLVHVPVQFYLLYPYSAGLLAAADRKPDYVAAIAASAALSWGLAFLLYRLVEVPCQRWKQRLVRA